jgi:TonB family protein
VKETLLFTGLALLLLGNDCGEAPRRPPQAAAVPPPRIDEDAIPVIPVHLESLQGVDEARIIRQYAEIARPRLIARKEIEYPPDYRPWGGKPGVLIVEMVIAPDGRIARFKLLRGPQDEILYQALAAAMKEWRFVPAKVQGAPVAVYYVLPIPVNEKAAPPAG